MNRYKIFFDNFDLKTLNHNKKKNDTKKYKQMVFL